MRRFFASFLEVFEIALVAVGAVFLIRTFLIQPFLVSGSSMVPNFQDGDYLLVDQVTYRFRAPERGEVVVFRSPGNESTYFVKRIIGLPDETMEISGGKIFLVKDDGREELKEPYLPPGFSTRGEEKFSLGEGEYLFLGDNRSFSFDSRSWGALSYEHIVGLVRIRLWPIDEIRAFAAPSY
ncbi:MAG: signal peptidase I [Patescibacteria group bacterium]